jgi:hypothetical protein
VAISSRFIPHIPGGSEQGPDEHAAEALRNGDHRISHARSSGRSLRRTPPLRFVLRGYFERREREGALVEANTGPCKVLMRDGVWLVPEDERPKAR